MIKEITIKKLRAFWMDNFLILKAMSSVGTSLIMFVDLAKSKLTILGFQILVKLRYFRIMKGF